MSISKTNTTMRSNSRSIIPRKQSTNSLVSLPWKRRKEIGIIFSCHGRACCNVADQTCPRGFKGLKQAIKLEFAMRRYVDAVKHYQELLTYVKSAVTRNYSEKSINNMLDFIEKNAEDDDANKCMEHFYSKTLESFQTTNNERLWLKTNTKLARLWLDQKDYRRLTDKLRELHRACQKDDGSDDPAKGTYLLEIYALEILMYAETRNNKRLKVRAPYEPNMPALFNHLDHCFLPLLTCIPRRYISVHSK